MTNPYEVPVTEDPIENVIIEPILEAELYVLNDQLRRLAADHGNTLFDEAYKAAYRVKGTRLTKGISQLDLSAGIAVFDGDGNLLREGIDYGAEASGWLLFAQVPSTPAEVAYKLAVPMAAQPPEWTPNYNGNYWVGGPLNEPFDNRGGLLYGAVNAVNVTYTYTMPTISSCTSISEYTDVRTATPGSPSVSVD